MSGSGELWNPIGNRVQAILAIRPCGDRKNALIRALRRVTVRFWSHTICRKVTNSVSLGNVKDPHGAVQPPRDNRVALIAMYPVGWVLQRNELGVRPIT